MSLQVDIKLPNVSMSVMKKKFQTNPLDHLDHSLQGDILKLEALEKKKNNRKARNETSSSSSFKWSNSLVEVELPDQVFLLPYNKVPLFIPLRLKMIIKSTCIIPESK